MKRNRLINSSSQSRQFINLSLSFFSSKPRHILVLSLLTITGVFLTSIVLATSEPSIDKQFVVIPLPDQNIEHDDINRLQPLSIKTISSSYRQTPHPALSSKIETDSSAVDKQVTVKERRNQRLNNSFKNANTLALLDWQEVIVKPGDNLSLIFPRVGLSARDVYNVAQLGDDIKPLLKLQPGQTLRFGLSKEDDGTVKLEQLQLQISAIKTFLVKNFGRGYLSQLELRETVKKQREVYGVIQSSLFEAGQKAGISDKIIMEMAYIFGWDIDFALDIRQQDSFKVIFEESFLDGEKFKDGNILAAEFTNRGKTYRAIRYTDPEGDSHFYTPDGVSMRKTFNRTPVHFSRISSRFNLNRKHPILKTNRPHRGVDYAAPTGTPILATGDGKVDFIGKQSGYGRTVILSHGEQYTTLYAHMSRYRSGLKHGSRVRQGQTIGYVGSSGLATGPHLHYEFRVSGVHHNPLTVTLPKAKPLDKKYLDDFNSKAQPLLAQLDQISPSLLPLFASNQ